MFKLFQDKYRQSSINLINLLKNFGTLTVKYHTAFSILGFFLVLGIIFQLVSGTLLSFSLVPEPMIIPVARDEEDIEVLNIDIIFWMHERGVDILFILFYLHLFRKIYISIFYIDQETTWKSGVILLIFFQVVTFMGLVLCCTHLSDITLSIASNIMHTFFNFLSHPYSWIFTDKKLNSDTIVRLAYFHYISAFFLFYMGLVHAVCMHFDWKADVNFDGLGYELTWFDEVLVNELLTFLDFAVFIFLLGFYLYVEPEALSYEIFMWGDIGAVNDVRFLGVAPHWYFRPFMAWLTVVPFHRTGIFGLLLFFVLIYSQCSIQTKNNDLVFLKGGFYRKKTKNFINIRYKFFWKFLYFQFLMVFLYTTTFLPSGKYYILVGGNFGMILSYLYVVIFLLSRKFIDIDNLNFFLKLYFLEDFIDFYKKVADKSSKNMEKILRELYRRLHHKSNRHFWHRNSR